MAGIRKRSVTIHGHRTSISLEDPFFARLETIAAQRKLSLSALIAEVDRDRQRDSGLSSALRLFVLDWVERHPASGDPDISG